MADLEDFFSTKEGKKHVNELSSGKDGTVINLDEVMAWDTVQAEEIIKGGEEKVKEIEHALSGILGRKVEREVGFVGECIPFIKIHDTASEHVEKIVRVRGLVNRTQVIKPMCIEAKFKCRNCGYITPLIVQESPYSMTLPSSVCESCKERVQYDIVEKKSKYIDSQEFSIQESHEDVSRRMPQRINMIILKKFMINTVYCGDLV